MSGALRIALAALAFTYLAVMFAYGARPTSEQFVAFEAAGVMAQAPDHVQDVGVEVGDRHWLIERRQQAWVLDDAALPADAASHLSLAVKFLHTARPVREVSRGDARPADPAFGLTAPGLVARVRLDDGTQFTLAFGAHIPDGSLQYVHTASPARLYLMSNFVGEEWAAVVAALSADAPP